MGPETLVLLQGAERFAIRAAGVLLAWFGARLLRAPGAPLASGGVLVGRVAGPAMRPAGGAASPGAPPRGLPLALALRQIRADLATPNRAERRLPPRLGPALRDAVQGAFRRARFALLDPVGQPAWGGAEVAIAARRGNRRPGEALEIATAQRREC